MYIFDWFSRFSSIIVLWLLLISSIYCVCHFVIMSVSISVIISLMNLYLSTVFGCRLLDIVDMSIGCILKYIVVSGFEKSSFVSFVLLSLFDCCINHSLKSRYVKFNINHMFLYVVFVFVVVASSIFFTNIFLFFIYDMSIIYDCSMVYLSKSISRVKNPHSLFTIILQYIVSDSTRLFVIYLCVSIL